MEVIKTFCCCDRRKTSVFKATGIAIGWLSLITSTWLIYEVLLTPAYQSTIVSIIYIILVLFLNVKESICKYVTIFLCGKFNLTEIKFRIFKSIEGHIMVLFLLKKNAIFKILFVYI